MNMSKRAATGGYDPSGIDLDAWTELEEQLEATIPNYDRVNRLMTFGQDKRWRRNVRNHASKGMKVLEVGCGPGSFAEDLVGLDVMCLDPSEAMLKKLTTQILRCIAGERAKGEMDIKFATAKNTKKELDPVIQILVHIVVALRGEAAKSEEVRRKAKQINNK